MRTSDTCNVFYIPRFNVFPPFMAVFLSLFNFPMFTIYSAFCLSVTHSMAVMAVADSPGPIRQIESNTSAAQRPTIE